MSDELHVLHDEDKPGRNLNKIYFTVGVLSGCILVLFSTCAVAISSHVAPNASTLNVNGTCHTHPCHLLRQRLNASLNPSQQPCTNFYRFVCSRNGSDQLAGQMAFDQIWTEEALHKAFHKVDDNPWMPSTGQTDAQKFAAFYLSCCRILSPHAHNVKSLKQFLRFFNFSWPKVRANQTQAFDLIVRMELQYNMGVFFRFGISLKRANAWDFTLKPPRMSKFIYSPTRKEKYVMYLDKLVKLMSRAKRHVSIVDSILRMEEELYQLALLQDKQRVDIRNLASLTPGIGPGMWIETFGKYFALSKFFTNHTVVIRSSRYFQALFSSLSHKEGALYLGWRVARFAGCFTHQVRTLEEAVQLNFDSCSQPIHKPKHFCRAVASKLMLPQLVAFATSALTSQEEVQGVHTIVENVRKSIVNGITLNPWLDNQTKIMGLEKLKKIRYLFPEMDNTTVTELPDMGPDFLQNWIHVAARGSAGNINVEGRIKRLYQEQVHFDIFKNQLHVPVSATKLPLYSDQLPASANYGRLGQLVANGILRSLDAQGKAVDERGRKNLWWSQNFTNIYKGRRACFARSYNATSKSNKANIVEDVINSAAIRYAYSAYKAVEDKTDGAILEGFSADQTFFLSYCHAFCDNVKDGENRCNKPLANTEEFSRAFVCRPNDPMSPSDRCYLW
ncbi:endothelin-converting enzyme 1-like [Ornithodoros turicata]|uniref:endothelin-converting enzyme 1-like n=1 Tax=Ornithodoros turicata TaxID=34597 RepID=UPI003139A82D